MVVVEGWVCTGQKSPNENGPVQQKLMTEGIRKARFPFNTLNYSGLQGPHLHCRCLCFPFLHSLSPSLERQNGPALGFGRYSAARRGRGELHPCKAGDYLPFPTKPGCNSHPGKETNKNTGQKRRGLSRLISAGAHKL